MKTVKVSEGNYIDYSVSKTKITFNDELMLNVAKYERDFPVTIRSEEHTSELQSQR